MNDDVIRKEFEAYALSKGYVSVSLKQDNGRYESYMLNIMSEAFSEGYRLGKS